MEIRVGCAGWSLRREVAEYFSISGSHLERYAAQLTAVEINSSFYKPHRLATYERWAETTPKSFRFSVKLPKRITHDCALVGVEDELDQFLSQIAGLGPKLGAILVQLPPSLAFDDLTAERFLRTMRTRTVVPIVCEPRHATWFTAEAETLLKHYSIGRVAADPAVVPSAAVPAGALQTIYFRWHGSPRMYYSSYDDQRLRELAARAFDVPSAQSVWCIFDNTAHGAALPNALALAEMLRAGEQNDRSV